MDESLSCDGSPQDELEYDGVVNLVAAIFRLTAQDIKLGDAQALEFVNSSWFEDICIGVQVDPEEFRYYILNNKIKSRVTYE